MMICTPGKALVHAKDKGITSVQSYKGGQQLRPVL